MNIKEIKDGWLNTIIKNDEVENIAYERLSICESCEFKVEIFGFTLCGECHCPLIAKTRSMDSKCPKNKW